MPALVQESHMDHPVLLSHFSSLPAFNPEPINLAEEERRILS